ncbi:NACHT, LRR and PYD domains-containing protein 3-like [Myxocyprinus asiaticus]|uniref:NACHT, LRR and PYD domains-containing protein 3-like n=1 Tax=Myxocyprinus asiaticus TaxID=70543 RepID=UPI002221AD9F|nr:NACHT, LRR and PYD domains-containing protein 3-like [Myxocyprinus asiaticus]XP_051559687.1 NACHT, LRR and PYD domains-containing protein 3-like [Myxocyprinus asiaticus]XP_051559688.1 NACHT, LRR and PYD domains-containing protein 3-like [Myxocyprinus asiaticus]
MADHPDRLCDSVSNQSSIVAHSGGVANVPQIIGCHVTGSVNFNIATHVHASANNEQAQCTDSSKDKATNAVQSNIQQLSERLKFSFKGKFERIFEGLAKRGNQTLLNRIYTELYIIEGESVGVNEEHEVWQIDTVMKTQLYKDTPIYCNDIFKPLPEPGCEGKRKDQIKTVLTKGIAGIGKTVSVQKFILDWAEGKANQDVDFMFVLPFRELNLIKDEQYSLHKLLLDFHHDLKQMESVEIYEKGKVVFIFDGLDESQLNMYFDTERRVSDVTKKAKVDDLIINLIKGNLLPSALLWITSRPAAEDKIPPEFLDRVTEIRGFTDPQKEEYFRKRISDEHQASRIISHIRKARSLHIMCHIPVFCWITATVLEKMLKNGNEQISSSLTEMYTRFLLIQINENKRKYFGIRQMDARKLSDSDVEIVLKLGHLSFEKLKEGVLVFSEKELRKFGIDVNETSEWPGICTHILKEEDPMFTVSKYSFVHFSFQEYLAALYVFCSFVVEKDNLLEPLRKKLEARRLAVYYDYSDDEYDHEYDGFADDDPNRASVKEETLHDFQRCAIDLALESPRGHLDLFLRFLLGLSSDHCQMLLRCFQLTENSVLDDIQKTILYIKTKLRDDNNRRAPSAERCINLLFCLLELGDQSMIEEIQRFNNSEQQMRQKLTVGQCSTLAYIIQMSEEVLDELDLSKYNTSEEGRLRLVPAVINCRNAKLSACILNKNCYETIASALLTSNSVLQELDVSWQCLSDLSPLLPGLESSFCRLQTLNFSHTKLEKTGAFLLRAALLGPHIQPHTLRVFACSLKDDCADVLALALELSESRLMELNLGYNNFTPVAVERVCQGILCPNCELMKFSLSGCQVSMDSCIMLASALRDSFLTKLDLTKSSLGDQGVKLLSAGLMSPHCQLNILRLRECALSGTSCLYLAVALSSFSVLRELDLSNNDLQDSGVKLLSAGLQNSIIKCLRLSGCRVTEDGCCYVASALISNPSHLIELDLSYNHPGELGVKLLSDRLNDPNCSLEILKLDHGGPSRIRRGFWKYYQELNMWTTHPDLALSPDRKGVIGLPKIYFPFFGEDEEPASWVEASCQEELSEGRFYWQVDWNGLVTIGVKFKQRKSFARKILKLFCTKDIYCATQEDKFRTQSISVSKMPKTKTIGVLLDCGEGTLSFYSIFSHGSSHLHTLHTTFSEPVSPFFMFNVAYEETHPPSVIIHTLVPSSVVQTQIMMIPNAMDVLGYPYTV